MRSRYKSLVVLMICSQLFLTAFVVQWLLSQYENEKRILHNELVYQFETSQQEVMDTLLAKSFIEPLLRRKEGFKIHFDDSLHDHLSKDGSLKMFIRKKESGDSTEIVTVFTDSSHGSTADREFQITDSTEDFLLHGVKMIVKEVAGDGKHKLDFERRLHSSSDTTLLKKIIEEKFKSKGWDFREKWVQRNPGDSFPRKRQKDLFLQSSIFPKTFGLEVGNFRIYLLKKITPQIAFAVVLLLLTGFAFIVSNRMLKKQLRLNTMKNDLIDNISHELKTPLSTVKVVVEALQDENIRRDEKTMREYLDMASIEISRLEVLTGTVLSTSMLEGGITKLQNQRIDLLKIVNDLVYSLKVRLTNERATVSVNATDDSYFTDGDPLHIQGALLNLIDNAIKYSGSEPKIDIELSKLNSTIEIKVMDNGLGIPSEFHKKIFEKFFRVSTGNLHNVKGYGLGLSYVDTVMKMHGGKVTVENSKSGGTIFTLTFAASV